ncbi:MAG: hypothetical protein S4CHLAM123_03530 [Chlamydiales bacterium]|nr:hypothetical protein [Chlamydiales bacterium]
MGVNVSLAAEKKSVFFLDKMLSQLLPKSLTGRTFIWTFLPTLLLLLTVGVSFLSPSVFTLPLPFLALVTAGGCVCFRTRGLIGSYIAISLFVLLFYQDLSLDDKLWQFGIIFSLGLTLFITLLSVEEIDHCFEQMNQVSNDNLAHLRQTELDFQNAQQAWEQKLQELEEEIERLKTEAELRRIEKHESQQQFTLIQSEIELLTSQKNTLLEEARALRVNSESHVIDFDTEERIQALEKQLEQKFNESQVLSEELVQRSASLEDAQANSLQLELKLAQALEETKQHQANLDTLQQKLNESQERVLFLQQNQESIAPDEVLQKECNRARGLYSQLRIQFEEKSEILSQTRKELFASQERLEILAVQARLDQLEPNRQQEMPFLEQELESLREELQRVEGEVIDLEGLVSHVLLR